MTIVTVHEAKTNLSKLIAEVLAGGKVPEAGPLATNLQEYVEEQGFRELPIGIGHGMLAGNLQIAHKDPFDRLLIAQALCESMPLVSNEAVFDEFGVSRLW